MVQAHRLCWMNSRKPSIPPRSRQHFVPIFRLRGRGLNCRPTPWPPQIRLAPRTPHCPPYTFLLSFPVLFLVLLCFQEGDFPGGSWPGPTCRLSPATEGGEWLTVMSLASQGTSRALWLSLTPPPAQEPGSLEKLRAGSGQALCSQGNCILTPSEKPWSGLGDNSIENQRGQPRGAGHTAPSLGFSWMMLCAGSPSCEGAPILPPM